MHMKLTVLAEAPLLIALHLIPVGGTGLLDLGNES
jgi:hypothetical protein